MDLRVAKELLHIREWLAMAGKLADQGRTDYEASGLLQEAGDSLMMKIGEAAARLDKAGIDPPPNMRWRDAIANRNWLIHQYDHIDREITWATITVDLPVWRVLLADLFAEAEERIAR